MRSYHRGWPERFTWASRAAVRVTVDPSFSLRSPAAGGSAKESVQGRNHLGGRKRHHLPARGPSLSPPALMWFLPTPGDRDQEEGGSIHAPRGCVCGEAQVRAHLGRGQGHQGSRVRRWGSLKPGAEVFMGSRAERGPCLWPRRPGSSVTFVMGP